MLSTVFLKGVIEAEPCEGLAVEKYLFRFRILERRV